MNTILSAHSAMVDGMRTGLAGCKNTTCPSRARCLRADDRLDSECAIFRKSEGCESFIPNSNIQGDAGVRRVVEERFNVVDTAQDNRIVARGLTHFDAMSSATAFSRNQSPAGRFRAMPA